MGRKLGKQNSKYSCRKRMMRKLDIREGTANNRREAKDHGSTIKVQVKQTCLGAQTADLRVRHDPDNRESGVQVKRREEEGRKREGRSKKNRTPDNVVKGPVPLRLKKLGEERGRADFEQRPRGTRRSLHELGSAISGNTKVRGETGCLMFPIPRSDDVNTFVSGKSEKGRGSEFQGGNNLGVQYVLGKSYRARGESTTGTGSKVMVASAPEDR